MPSSPRLQAAVNAAFRHFLVSVFVALVVAMLVFLVWYPYPYSLLSGGRNIFLLLIAVDVICGPLLTLILFNPKKSRRELFLDLGLVAIVQVAALAYGINTTYQARPLFLVHEIDRFRVISRTDYSDADISQALLTLAPSLTPKWHRGPVIVGIRAPKDSDERQTVLFESIFGGRDYSQRPEFYVSYDAAYQKTALARSKPLTSFIQRYPEKSEDASEILHKHKLTMGDAVFLPVMHKQEWIAIMNKSADILGFLPGDGFEVK